VRRPSRRAGASAVVAGALADMPHIVTDWKNNCMLCSAWKAAVGVSVVVPVAASSSSKRKNLYVRGTVPAVKSGGVSSVVAGASAALASVRLFTFN